MASSSSAGSGKPHVPARHSRVKRIRGRHLEIVDSASTSVLTYSFAPEVFMADVNIHRPITTFVDRPSEDGRRMYRDVVPIQPPSPVKNARINTDRRQSQPIAAPSPPFSFSDASDDRYEMFHDGTADDPPVPSLPDIPRPRKAIFSVSFYFRREITGAHGEIGQDPVRMEEDVPRPLRFGVSADGWMRGRQRQVVPWVLESGQAPCLPLSRMPGGNPVLQRMLCGEAFGAPSSYC
jgi:hypothetical protein